MKTYRICNQAQIEISTAHDILVYGVNNDVAWLTLDSCYVIGWNQKNARGDSCLNEHFHSDQNHCGHSHGDSHENVHENARGDSREWGRCLIWESRALRST